VGLRHLSSKPKPDLRNSIKESISAVEAMTQIATGEKGVTLADALESAGIQERVAMETIRPSGKSEQVLSGISRMRVPLLLLDPMIPPFGRAA
jgi:hypothetical protein